MPASGKITLTLIITLTGISRIDVRHLNMATVLSYHILGLSLLELCNSLLFAIFFSCVLFLKRKDDTIQ